MNPRAILFDFDYTLADSSEAIIDCFNVGLTGLGLPAASPDAIRATIGLSLEESLVAVAGEAFRPRTLEFRQLWRCRSDAIMVNLTRLLPGAAETVRSLRGRGLQLGVVSTKYRCRIEEVLERTGLRSSFATIVGGDDVAGCKPSPEGLLLAMERLGATPAETLFVGDSVVDSEAAQRAGVPFIGVLSGVTTAARLAAWNAADILASIESLPERLATKVSPKVSSL